MAARLRSTDSRHTAAPRRAANPLHAADAPHRADPLRTALASRRVAGTPGAARVARQWLAPGLCVADIVCTSGPSDAPFDERHAHVAIAAVIAGSFAYRGEHGRVLLTPGALLLGNPDASFSCSHDHGEGDRCLAFHFEAAAFERLAADLGVSVGVGMTGARWFARHRVPPSRATAPFIAQAERLVERERLAVDVENRAHLVAHAEEGDAPGPDTLALEETALALAAAVLSEHGRATATRDARSPIVRARDERRAADVARLLEETFERRHGLASLAAHAGMSPFHFLRVFRNVVGATPHQFLLRLRLQGAARLLHATRDPATDIAYTVGFEDLSNFVRSFRAEFGVSPSRYRAAHPR